MTWAVFVVAAAIVVAGCAQDVVPRDSVSPDEVEALRDDPGLPLYYAGESFAGLRLTSAHGWQSESGEAFFGYGTCKLPEGEGGCPVPIQIQHFRFQPGQWRRAANCRMVATLRGVPTARHDGLVLFTGSIVVKIYARSGQEERRVARALHSLNTSLTTGRPLPAPPERTRRLIAEVC